MDTTYTPDGIEEGLWGLSGTKRYGKTLCLIESKAQVASWVMNLPYISPWFFVFTHLLA